MNWKWIIAAIVGAAFIAGVLGFMLGRRGADDEVSDLTTRLAQAEQTVEIAKNLYAEKVAEIENLSSLLRDVSDASSTAIEELVKKIEAADQRVLTLQKNVVYWKTAYEGAVEASQGEQPSDDPVDPSRKRVDFRKDFGYIGVTGHTLTDPPEGYVKVEQLRPLRLTVAVTKNKDGTWSSYVASSEDNVAVDLGLSALDLSVTKPKWYQRLWVESGAVFLGEPSASIGLSYRGDRFSVGPQCALSAQGGGCGISVGARIFK